MQSCKEMLLCLCCVVLPMTSGTVVSAVSFILHIVVIISRHLDYNTFLLLTRLAIKVNLILITHTPGNLTHSFLSTFLPSGMSLNIKKWKS